MCSPKPSLRNKRCSQFEREDKILLGIFTVLMLIASAFVLWYGTSLMMLY